MLKFWLPFDKDERNIGLSSCGNFPSAKNVTMYQSDGPNGFGYCHGGMAFHQNEDEFGNEFTIATWIRMSSWTTDGSNDIISCKNTNAASNCQWYFSQVSGKLNLAVNGGAGGFRVTATFTNNVWMHVAGTYDGKTIKLYVNGEYMGSQNKTSEQIVGALNIGVGCRSNSADGSVITNPTRQLSDFRIYNHVLDDWEIKDLYNCKVFGVNGGMYLEETTNLITGITKGGQTNVVNNEVLTTGTNADTYFTLNLSESIVVGTQYTISCYADLPSGTYWDFPIGAQSNTGLTWRITPGYNSYTFTANDINYGTNRVFMDDLTGPARTSGQQCRFYRFQLEKKSHATPLSFGHRDSRIADLTDFNQNSITPYSLVKSGSTLYFDGVNSAIKIPGHELISAGTWTVNLWFLKPNGMWSSKGYETLFGGPSGFELEAKSAATNVNKIVLWNWGKGNCEYEFDKWNMVTMTRTSSGVKLYLNGELKTTGSAGSMPTGNYFIGAWNTATQQNFKGYIRSVSIYKKELSQEDITNLYIHGQ